MPERRLGGFDNLPQALSYAAGFPDLGMGYFDARGELDAWLSYSQLHERARSFAKQLATTPFEDGAAKQFVGVLGATSPDFLASFVACQMLGWVPCVLPVPAALQDMARYRQSVEYMCAAAGISLLIAPQKMLAVFDGVKHAQSGHGVAQLAFEALAANDVQAGSQQPLVDVQLAGADMAYVQFSSGSTGKPKGIAISHAALMAQADCVLQHGLRVGPQDRAFSWLPYYHDMGLVGMVLSPLCGQVPVDYLAPTSFVRRPGLWLSLMSQRASTITYAPGFAYSHAAGPLAKLDDKVSLSKLRIAGVGGDQLRLKELTPFIGRYAAIGFEPDAFKPSYGLAEATLAVSMSDAPFADLHQHFSVHANGLVTALGNDAKCPTNASGADKSLMTCGKPLPGWVVDVRDADGQVLPPMHIGQIMIHGASQMMASLEHGAVQLRNMNQPLATGDLGFLTTEGELFLTGREKDLLIIRGRNIFPAEIEHALADALAVDVDDLMLMQPDDDADDARLTLLAHAKVFAHATLDAVTQAAAGALGAQVQVLNVPNGSIERTSSGKKARALTRERFLA